MLVIILYTFLSSVVSNASITVMPLSPRLVVGGNYVGDLTPCSNMPFGRGICIIRGSTCTFLYLFSTDERDGPCRRESGNYPVQIPYYTLPPTNLGG